jgi:hypothetical protein
LEGLLKDKEGEGGERAESRKKGSKAGKQHRGREREEAKKEGGRDKGRGAMRAWRIPTPNP